MTKLYLDCEWDEDKTLLSVALVATLTCGFSGVYVEIDAPVKGEWQRKHLTFDAARKYSRHEAGHLIAEYLNRFETVKIIADWPEDISQLCNLLISEPGAAFDVTCKITFQWRRDLNTEKSLIPHHALHDAIALQEMDR